MEFDARALRRLLAISTSAALLAVASAATAATAAPTPPGGGEGRIVGADRPGAVQGSY
ncbi:S8 family peptidase, partial [Streptomyces sp. SID6041]|nr:S8 family peptidase [Streptomyces sp. SID6041]